MNPIPYPITVTTGEQEQVTKTIDDFFSDTKRSIESYYEMPEPGWQIKTGEISYNSTSITDDRVTYLSYQDKIIAGVLVTRTEFNYICYTFFRNIEGLGKLARIKQ